MSNKFNSEADCNIMLLANSESSHAVADCDGYQEAALENYIKDIDSRKLSVNIFLKAALIEQPLVSPSALKDDIPETQKFSSPCPPFNESSFSSVQRVPVVILQPCSGPTISGFTSCPGWSSGSSELCSLLKLRRRAIALGFGWPDVTRLQSLRLLTESPTTNMFESSQVSLELESTSTSTPRPGADPRIVPPCSSHSTPDCCTHVHEHDREQCVQSSVHSHAQASSGKDSGDCGSGIEVRSRRRSRSPHSSARLSTESPAPISPSDYTACQLLSTKRLSSPSTLTTASRDRRSVSVSGQSCVRLDIFRVMDDSDASVQKKKARLAFI